MTLTVAGFDPGLAAGVAIVERRQRYLVRLVRPISSDSADPIEDRCRFIFKELERAMREAGAHQLAIEWQDGAQQGQIARGQGNKTILDVQKVVGVALSVAYAYGHSVAFVDPKQAKIALLGKGTGSADKKQVKAGVEALCDFERGCRLSQHTADAVAIAIRRHQELSARGWA